MRRATSLNALKNSPYAWKARWTEDGKARFRYYRAGQKGEAENFLRMKAIEAANHGTRHGTVSDDERAALILFRDGIAKMPDPKPTLSDAVNAFLEGIKLQLKPITVSDLVARRAAAAQAKGVHTRTLHDLIGTDGTKGKLGAFARSFGERQAATISREEVRAWVNAQCATDSNRREMLVRLRGLFTFGVKEDYLASNVLEKMELPRPSASRAAILTVSECAKLLLACPARSVPAVAVQLFAGLRHAECERLQWEAVDFEHGTIRVTQRKGAGKRREKFRFATLTPALSAWLAPHRRISGPVFPTGRTDGKASAQAYRNDFTEARTAAGITEWDENTLRHSFGSYRLAGISDLEKVRMEMGHTTARTTSEHYVNAVRAVDAAQFWNLRPGGAGEKVAEMPSAKTA